jgi:hypothetical protein
MKNKKIVCSFCHGYAVNKIQERQNYPALIELSKKKIYIHNYIFPRNYNDFRSYKDYILGGGGDIPVKKNRDFKKLPRFGFTGLSQNKTDIFAATWNGIHVIQKKNFQLSHIISHKLTADLHGICVHKNKIYSTLTFKDTLVITNINGEIENFLTITDDLKVIKDKNILKVDWRFITKQRRGPTGVFHFNHIRVEKNNVFLTSRNLGGVIKLNLKSLKARLMTIGHMKTSLIHDGKKYKNYLYFTSVDGKILKVGGLSSKERLKFPDKRKLKFFNNSNKVDYFYIGKKNLKRTPSWCRGIEVLSSSRIVTTVDGTYGTNHFSIIIVDLKKDKKIYEYKFRIKKLDNYKKLQYVSGFDLISF